MSRPAENSKDLILEDISPLNTNHKTVLDIHSYASSRFNLPALADISEKIYIKLIYRDFILELSRSNSEFKYLNLNSQKFESSSEVPLITSLSEQPKIVIDPGQICGVELGHICSAIFMYLIENDAGQVFVQGKARIRIHGLLNSIMFGILFKINSLIA